MGMAKSVNWQYYDEPERVPHEPYWASGTFPALSQLTAAAPGGVYGASFMAADPYLLQRESHMAAPRGPAEWPPPPQPRLLAAAAAGPPMRLPAAMAAPLGVPQDATIIWDWDDTLMCSSAINANQLQLHQAQQLESILEQVLTLSMRLGDTCIVTNADELWVLESTRRFAPRVLPLLSQIAVVSARRKYERRCPGDVFAWKRETFREVLGSRLSAGAGGSSALNLVVLGDSPAEMEAAQTATMGLMIPMVIKTVKFKEAPSVEDLLEQLRIVAQELGAIVADERSCCRNLVQWMRPQQQQQLAAPPATLAYSAVPMASAAFAYSPQLLPAPYAAFPSTYLGAPMIYATGH